MCLLLMVFYCFLFSPSTANRMLKIEKIYTMRDVLFCFIRYLVHSPLPTPPLRILCISLSTIFASVFFFFFSFLDHFFPMILPFFP